jgi:hypothetical protein
MHARVRTKIAQSKDAAVFRCLMYSAWPKRFSLRLGIAGRVAPTW